MSEELKAKIERIMKICNAGNFLYVIESESSIQIQRDPETSTYIKKEHIEDLFVYDDNNINIYTKTGGFVFINLKDQVFITQF